MATSRERVDEIMSNLTLVEARTRAMFGEYGLYCNDKFVGMICDNTLYVKPVDGQSDLTAGLDVGPPYPSARDHWIIPDERILDTEWICALLQRTADALPLPKPRKSARR